MEFQVLFNLFPRLSVLLILELRDELSNELKDVLAVVESNYLEEERRQRDEQETNQRKNYQYQKSVAQARFFSKIYQVFTNLGPSKMMPFKF